MEKRILGIILSIIGVIGLILAAVRFANGGSGGQSIRMIVIYAILGAIFFFSGISLVRNTRDKATGVRDKATGVNAGIRAGGYIMVTCIRVSKN